mmetsp:Transcript_104465/g.291046  ORF Transcript_104465/g.291046 Transcript_104465/m.291046 type:complete len:216 (-) Transcript_104465:273-920(-)
MAARRHGDLQSNPCMELGILYSCLWQLGLLVLPAPHAAEHDCSNAAAGKDSTRHRRRLRPDYRVQLPDQLHCACCLDRGNHGRVFRQGWRALLYHPAHVQPQLRTVELAGRPRGRLYRGVSRDEHRKLPSAGNYDPEHLELAAGSGSVGSCKAARCSELGPPPCGPVATFCGRARDHGCPDDDPVCRRLCRSHHWLLVPNVVGDVRTWIAECSHL